MRCSYRKLLPKLGLAAMVALPVVSAASAATVGMWLFDEGSGATIADSSGNGNAAAITWNGTGGWSTDSPFEPNAANNSYGPQPNQIEVASAPALNPSGDFTIELWVKFSNPASAAGYLVSKRNVGGAGSGYILEYSPGGNLQFTTINSGGFHGTSGTIGSGAFSSVPLAADVWYHVAGVHNSIENTLYVDGVSNGGNGSGGSADANTSPLTFGYYAGGSNFMSGLLIDEARLSNAALSPAELGWSVGSLAVVPEPASLSLLALMGFGAFRRRR